MIFMTANKVAFKKIYQIITKTPIFFSITALCKKNIQEKKLQTKLKKAKLFIIPFTIINQQENVQLKM